MAHLPYVVRRGGVIEQVSRPLPQRLRETAALLVAGVHRPCDDFRESVLGQAEFASQRTLGTA
jgi:hypothetical protein